MIDEEGSVTSETRSVCVVVGWLSRVETYRGRRVDCVVCMAGFGWDREKVRHRDLPLGAMSFNVFACPLSDGKTHPSRQPSSFISFKHPQTPFERQHAALQVGLTSESGAKLGTEVCFDGLRDRRVHF